MESSRCSLSHLWRPRARRALAAVHALGPVPAVTHGRRLARRPCAFHVERKPGYEVLRRGATNFGARRDGPQSMTWLRMEGGATDTLRVSCNGSGYPQGVGTRSPAAAQDRLVKLIVPRGTVGVCMSAGLWILSNARRFDHVLGWD